MFELHSQCDRRLSLTFGRQGCCLSGCLSGNPVVEGVLLHVVRPGGGRHAPVRVQEDPETAHDQQAQEDEEDEDEDEGRPLLEREEGGGR